MALNDTGANYFGEMTTPSIKCHAVPTQHVVLPAALLVCWWPRGDFWTPASDYPVVRRELWVCIFPIKWGAIRSYQEFFKFCSPPQQVPAVQLPPVRKLRDSQVGQATLKDPMACIGRVDRPQAARLWPTKLQPISGRVVPKDATVALEMERNDRNSREFLFPKDYHPKHIWLLQQIVSGRGLTTRIMVRWPLSPSKNPSSDLGCWEQPFKSWLFIWACWLWGLIPSGD